MTASAGDTVDPVREAGWRMPWVYLWGEAQELCENHRGQRAAGTGEDLCRELCRLPRKTSNRRRASSFASPSTSESASSSSAAQAAG